MKQNRLFYWKAEKKVFSYSWKLAESHPLGYETSSFARLEYETAFALDALAVVQTGQENWEQNVFLVLDVQVKKKSLCHLYKERVLL